MQAEAITEYVKGGSKDAALLLTIADAAEALSVSGMTIRRLLTIGQLDAVRLGRAVRVTRSSIDHLIQSGGVAEVRA